MSQSVKARRFARAILLATVSTGAFATLAAPAIAQEEAAGRIEGRIVDAERGNNLRGATVSIPSLNVQTTTDSEGAFVLRRVPAGTYEVRISYVGRETITQTVTVRTAQASSFDAIMVRAGQALMQDEIVVTATPIADSEAAALSRQLASDNVINVISSDSIGRFPDRNAADALGRVPGISIERDQGQARFVNVRGAPAEFSTIAFNGVSAPTPSQGGRLARFDTIPNDVIGSIEVVKAITPDLPADSIGGFINIETSGAFDRPGLSVDSELALGVKQLGGGELFNGQVTVSNTFLNDTLGVLASGSFFHDNKVTDNTENRFEDVNGVIFPNQADFRIYNLERQNTSGNLRLDWRPNDQHEFFWNTIYSSFSDFELRDQHVYDLDDGMFGDIDSSSSAVLGNTPIRGTVFGVELDATFNLREDIESIFTTQIGGASDFEMFQVEWSAGFNRSTSERDPDNAYWEYDINNTRDDISVTYDYSDPDMPIVTVYDTVFDAAANTYSLGDRLPGPPVDAFIFENLEIEDTLGQVDEYFGQVDIDYPWSPFGVASDLKFGGKITLRNATREDTDLEVTDDIEALGFDTAYSLILSDRLSRATFPQPAMFEFGESASRARRDALFDLARANNLILTQNNVWEGFYDVREDIYAVYLMNTFRFDKFDVIVGGRIETTRTEAIGNQPLDLDAIEDILSAGSSRGITLAELYAARDANGNPILQQVKSDNDYTDFFPSLHVNYRPREDLVFRLAYTEAIQRPGFNQLAPNREIGEDSDENPGGVIFISGGNPGLEPYRAKSIDAYAEYYLPYRGIVSFGLFWKQIDDPIFDSTQQVDGAAFGFPNNPVRLSGPLNGSDGEISGFEFNYSQQFGFLPEPWDGFGASVNYTKSEDSARTPPLFNPATGQNDGLSRETGLSGASDETYNISVFFEKYGVSTRLTYQYRSPWLNAIDLGDDRLDLFWDARPSLDFSFRYSMNDNVTFFLDANNLTDEFGRRYNGTTERVYEVEGFGQSYLAGIRISY